MRHKMKDALLMLPPKWQRAPRSNHYQVGLAVRLCDLKRALKAYKVFHDHNPQHQPSGTAGKALAVATELGIV